MTQKKQPAPTQAKERILTVEDHRRRIVDLTGRMSAIGPQRAALLEERRSLASRAFCEGDSAARERISVIAIEDGQLSVEAEGLQYAIENEKTAIGQLEAGARAARERELAEQRAILCAALAKDAAVFDATCLELLRAGTIIDSKRRQLTALGGCDASIKRTIDLLTRAAQSAGLAAILRLEHMAPSNVASLAEQFASIHGKVIEDPATE